jgi:hypothetical protein
LPKNFLNFSIFFMYIKNKNKHITIFTSLKQKTTLQQRR